VQNELQFRDNIFAFMTIVWVMELLSFFLLVWGANQGCQGRNPEWLPLSHWKPRWNYFYSLARFVNLRYSILSWWVLDQNFLPESSQPPLGLENFTHKSHIFQNFYLWAKKNIIRLSQKIPVTKHRSAKHPSTFPPLALTSLSLSYYSPALPCSPPHFCK